MNHIDLFKQRIKIEVANANADKKFVDNLFSQIKDKVSIAAESLGLQEVDDSTLLNYFETAKKQFLSNNPIDPGISHSLTKKGYQTWLTENREKRISWDYSDRYFKSLLNGGRSEKVVTETERSSLSILKKMADPKSKTAIYNKGLVVGAVQSGKTGNFNAVINRAIDSGYVLIIVLSGIMEDLRSQTQKRIENDVIGEGKIDSGETSGAKGVGKIERFGVSGNSKVIQVKTLTSEQKDFSKAVEELDHTLNDKYVLVCKKNVSVLKNLIIWLHNSLEEGKSKHNIPLLILDDEADNASLNNLGAKGREYASKTNGHIRAILEMFHVKSYLGYTATPFANVLQDRNEYPENNWEIKYKFKGEEIEKQLKRVNNIFPDDFIELLDPPSNYVGAKQIFETIGEIDNLSDENEKIPLIAPVVDDYIKEFPSRLYLNEDGEEVGVENITKDEWDETYLTSGYLGFYSHSEYRKETRAPRKEDEFPKALPESLKKAVKCFFISLAIRESRIPKMINSDFFQQHNTMLVHISRFTFWQNRTKKLIEDYVRELCSRIDNEKPSAVNSIYKELEILWYSTYGFAHIVENIDKYLPKGYEDEFMSPIVFDSLKNHWDAAISGIEVKAINSFTNDSLEYPKNSPKKIIAIGGNRLSRGFTLEGLTINYFTRVTNYSDALLQMGRWFGYRPGYLDCCKIFTTQDSLDKFHSTTRCIEELETEFIKMEEQGKTPENFVLRVKKHPGTLKITRPSILKNAFEVRWSYQDQLEMSTLLKVDKQSISDIWANFKNNIAPKLKPTPKLKDMITYNTNAEEVINILKNQPNNFNKKDSEYMSRFIELCNQKGYLNDWTIALKITGSSKPGISASSIGLSPTLGIDNVELAKRSGPTKPDDITKFINGKLFRASGKSANILSSNEDVAIFLTESEKTDAKEAFYNFKAVDAQKKDSSLNKEDALNLAKSKYKTIPERYYRQMFKPNKGLLIIYLFDSQYSFNEKTTGRSSITQETIERFKEYVSDNDIDTSIPLVGYALEFPPMADDPGEIYMQGDYNLETDEIDKDDELEGEDERESVQDLNEV